MSHTETTRQLLSGRSGGFRSTHNVEGDVAYTLLQSLLNDPAVRDRLASHSGMKGGEASLDSGAASIILQDARWGQHRVTLPGTVALEANGESKNCTFALKIATNNSAYVMSHDDCCNEVKLGEALRDNSSYQRYCTTSFGVVEAEYAPSDSVRLGALRSGRDVSTMTVRAQLDSWAEGPTLAQLLQRPDAQIPHETKQEVVEGCRRAIVELWDRAAFENRGVIYDTAADDIVIAPNGGVIFVDADGGKRCGGAAELFAALATLTLSVNRILDNSPERHKAYSSHGEAIANTLVNVLDLERALHIANQICEQREIFTAETRLLLLPTFLRGLERLKA